MAAPQSRPRQAKPLDAGVLQPEISSFRLHLAAEGKAATTVRTYTEAVRWFAAACLLPQGSRTWEEVRKRDVQQWVAWLLDRYSAAYASNQFRARQQFFTGQEPFPQLRWRPQAEPFNRARRAGPRLTRHYLCTHGWREAQLAHPSPPLPTLAPSPGSAA
jgi:hypothetical protein